MHFKNGMKKPEIFGNSGLFIAQPGENGENSHWSVRNPNPRIRDQKAVGKGFDDRRWRIFHRILSQPIGSELHSVESRPYRLRPEGESRHFDSPGHCKTMLPGFCFSWQISGFFRFATCWVATTRQGTDFRLKKITSVNFRKFPVFSALKMSTLKIFLTTDSVEPGFSRRKS